MYIPQQIIVHALILLKLLLYSSSCKDSNQKVSLLRPTAEQHGRSDH